MSPIVCPVCASQRGECFLSIEGQPVLIGALFPSAQAARAIPRGNIDLAFCPDCGFIWNTSFDPNRINYDKSYDNSLHYSRTFQRHTESVVDRLVKTYGLTGCRVVDIGCGKGDFLSLLCEAGQNVGFGFDPSYDDARVTGPGSESITWSTEYYGEEHARIQADLIASRYVFEHVPQPLEFLRMIRSSISGHADTVVFFEVPDVDLIIRQGSIWDVIYEHCSYFSVESLSRVFINAGFEILRVEEPYGRQFITIEARASAGSSANAGSEVGNLAQLRADVAAFGILHKRKIAEWRAQIACWRNDGRRVVAWGAGAKAVGFFNMLAVDATIDAVVDINPHKQGRFLPGTGHQIIPPEALCHRPPDAVVLMNPLYHDEVAQVLLSLGLTSELVAA